MIKDVYRSDYSNPDKPVPPNQIAYTGITLEQAYWCFCIGLLTYAVTVFIVKMVVSDNFRRASIGSKALHVAETVTFPSACGRWDSRLDHDDLQKRWRVFLLEDLLMIALQAVSNLALMVPLLYTGRPNCSLYLSAIFDISMGP